MTTLSNESRYLSKEKRKLSQSDPRLYRRAKMQRRCSKVGYMFFADMKQARDELQKETNFDNDSEQSTFTIPLDRFFGLDRKGIIKDEGLFESNTSAKDTPFGFLTVPFLFHEKQEASTDCAIDQKLRSLSIETKLLNRSR